MLSAANRATVALAFALVLVFVRTALASIDSAPMHIDPLVLIRHGALLGAGWDDAAWWRGATSVFLHGGLIHLGLAVVALLVVGPFVEEQYGGWMVAPLFVGLGVVAALGAGALGGGQLVSVGATGAVMGLLGAIAGVGHRGETRRSKTLRNEMLLFAIFVLFFGFVVDADQWGHACGFVAGGAFGLLVRPAALRGERGAAIAAGLGVAGLLAAAAIVVAAAVPLTGP